MPIIFFCLTQHCKVSSRCKKCGELFHPGWWTAFGLRELDEDLEEHAKTLNVQQDLECLKEQLLGECANYLHHGI